MHKNKLLLSALELENFQSITNPIRLELAPITLLYGPNSAGKSSVYDALFFLKTIFSENHPGSELHNELLSRWAHKSSDGPEQQRNLRVKAEVIVPHKCFSRIRDEFINGAFDREFSSLNFTGELDRLLEGQKLIYEISLEIDKDDEIIIKKLTISSEISYEDKSGAYSFPLKILEITNDDSASGSINKAIIKLFIDSNDDHFQYLEIQEGYEHFSAAYSFKNVFDELDSEEDFIEKARKPFTKGYVVDGLFIGGAIEFVDASPFRLWSFSEWEDANQYTVFREAYLDYITFFGRILTDSIERAFPLVRADRAIPKPSDTVMFSEGIDLDIKNPSEGRSLFLNGFRSKWREDYKFIKNLIQSEDSFFQDLAEWSHTHKTYLLMGNPEAEHILDPNEPFDKDTIDWLNARENIAFIPKSNPQIIHLERVNKYLSDHLFAETGYRIDCDINYLFPDTLLDSPDISEIVRCAAITKIYLVDSTGRRLEIEDVGSGIAFVVPVLVSISKNQISLIQQPELHLHPALQGALADAFIDRLNESEGLWQSIIETHSEHMLLKFLKRVRDTEKLKNRELKITPEDLAIYYFNPKPSGGVDLTRMMITPLGDFYNTWPRGFFDERYKDIFDE
jgi:predicted ATPase